MGHSEASPGKEMDSTKVVEVDGGGGGGDREDKWLETSMNLSSEISRGTGSEELGIGLEEFGGKWEGVFLKKKPLYRRFHIDRRYRYSIATVSCRPSL